MLEKIVIDNVSKSIKGVAVIKDVSLTINHGKIYGLMGVNGSGKTMLLRLISGLIAPTKGKIWYDNSLLGKDILFPPSIGILIERPSFLDGYTGMENLKMIADIRKKINADQIRDVIDKVGLNPLDNKKYKKYSLGMKQRLGVAAAIMEMPDLILLDEPFNALDTDGVCSIKKLILQEKDNGATIILTTHNEKDLFELSDYIIQIKEGRIVEHNETFKV